MALRLDSASLSSPSRSYGSPAENPHLYTEHSYLLSSLCLAVLARPYNTPHTLEYTAQPGHTGWHWCGSALRYRVHRGSWPWCTLSLFGMYAPQVEGTGSDPIFRGTVVCPCCLSVGAFSMLSLLLLLCLGPQGVPGLPGFHWPTWWPVGTSIPLSYWLAFHT